jgi:mitotic spindle assembly checkpoint protein MAD1
MNDQFKTPLNKVLRSAVKRDSLAAELERGLVVDISLLFEFDYFLVDPQTSSAKRQQRAQVFTSSISHASLERQLLAAQTAKLELETKLREKELQVERLERDRRWFADREKEEREEKEREREAHEQEKVPDNPSTLQRLLIILQRKSDSDNRSLRTSLSTLREEFADLQDVHQALSRSSNQTTAFQKAQITTLTHQSSLFKEELDQSKEMAQQREQAFDELQVQYDELSTRNEDTARRASDEESMSVVREELHRQANYLRTLESTNSKLTSELKILRERHTSIEVLREEKRGLEKKVLMLEEFRTKVLRLEAEVEAGRKEREQWYALKFSLRLFIDSA